MTAAPSSGTAKLLVARSRFANLPVLFSQGSFPNDSSVDVVVTNKA
jgi:hypothetical protein